MTDLLHESERLDNIGFDDLKLIQHKDFAYGVDSVLLAAFAAGETGAKGIPNNSYVGDIGTGNGVIPLIISHKIPGTDILGIDIRKDEIDRAERSIKLNGLGDRIKFLVQDVSDWDSDNTGICRSFNALVSNPPYFKRGGSIPSSLETRFIARHETTAGIYEIAMSASKMLENLGSFYLVHRPDRLVDIFDALRKASIEPKEMQMVLPHEGEASNLVLIRGVKNGGPELRILPDIVIRRKNGEYTDTLSRLYER